ncbi:MAG: AsmA-like C-terminal region-containing protein, partial [Casimicrobiaceae bacterium]
GKLNLKMELPLGKHAGNKIEGEYVFDDGRMQVAGGLPPLERLNGTLGFSEREVHATALTGELVGGPARFVVATNEGKVRVEGQGSIDLALLRNQFPKHALLSRFSGTTDWQSTVTSYQGATIWIVESTLKGAVVDFPAPVGKLAADALPLKIERSMPDPEHDLLTMNYGRVGKLVVERRLTPDNAKAERALLALGGATGMPDRRGLWIRGDVPTLNADAWLVLKEQLDAAAAGDDLPLTGGDVSIGALEVYGRQFRDLHIGATRPTGEWQIDLRSPELTGSARWQSAAAGRPNGRLVARLQKVIAPSAATHPSAAPVSKIDAPPVVNPWPALDISADSFTMKNHELGKLELIAQPNESDWRIDSLKISNDESTLTASGWWHNTLRAQQTELDVDLDVRDAGKYLSRMGLPDAIRGASTRLRGKLAWAGSPQDFDYLSLNGEFGVETGPGQFLKVDPGIGKLLGVLSLQAFRRRMSGDYQDLFGEGFAFDEITGDVRIQDGVMKSDNLRIAGPAARISIMGDTDLARETQKLRIKVQPTLSASLSMGAAALMLANPLIGAAIGAGSLLAQKIMKDPFEQMFSTTYVVTGSWSDPQVVRPGTAAAAAPDEGLQR